MAKTKTEKVAGIEEQIQQLENEKKRLIQEQKAQERKDRTKRLCKRNHSFWYCRNKGKNCGNFYKNKKSSFAP